MERESGVEWSRRVEFSGEGEWSLVESCSAKDETNTERKSSYKKKKMLRLLHQ